MKPLITLIIGAAIAGAVAALIAIIISSVTGGTVSALAGKAIGVAFGVTTGNIAGGPRAAAGRRSIGPAVLRGGIAGVTAGLTIFLVQGR